MFTIQQSVKIARPVDEVFDFLRSRRPARTGGCRLNRWSKFRAGPAAHHSATGRARYRGRYRVSVSVRMERLLHAGLSHEPRQSSRRCAGIGRRRCEQLEQWRVRNGRVQLEAGATAQLEHGQFRKYQSLPDPQDSSERSTRGTLAVLYSVQFIVVLDL